ncbi:hypothetical protein [Streptomyces sp. LS1784]|uniref:hypothetical protein n=1 Tax=Streptomyces sp. LS1784 TaxID=2851533 RepID=UPI001CCFCB7D|nr:hypothetical protein [Streptomyces sp. LS1784]
MLRIVARLPVLLQLFVFRLAVDGSHATGKVGASWVQVVLAWSLAFLLLAEWTAMGASWKGPSGTSAICGLSST